MSGVGSHPAIARGTIFSLSADTLTLATKGAISPHLLRQGASSQSSPSQQGDLRWPWRVDRDEVASVFVRQRRSLLGESSSCPSCTLASLLMLALFDIASTAGIGFPNGKLCAILEWILPFCCI